MAVCLSALGCKVGFVEQQGTEDTGLPRNGLVQETTKHSQPYVLQQQASKPMPHTAKHKSQTQSELGALWRHYRCVCVCVCVCVCQARHTKIGARADGPVMTPPPPAWWPCPADPAPVCPLPPTPTLTLAPTPPWPASDNAFLSIPVPLSLPMPLLLPVLLSTPALMSSLGLDHMSPLPNT